MPDPVPDSIQAHLERAFRLASRLALRPQTPKQQLLYTQRLGGSIFGSVGSALACPQGSCSRRRHGVLCRALGIAWEFVAKEVHKSNEAMADERATQVAEYVAHKNGLPIQEAYSIFSVFSLNS